MKQVIGLGGAQSRNPDERFIAPPRRVRLGAVLAADSPATVSQWAGSKYEERYFKGSNKIFQLSDHHPVGLMIFDSADVLRVPWEIVVKTFRSSLGKKSFNTVKDYALEFFGFLEQANIIFPNSIQDEVFLDSARSAAVTIVHRDKFPDNDDERMAAHMQTDQLKSAELEAMTYNSALNDELLATALAKWTAPLAEYIEEWRHAFGQGFPDDLHILATAGILEIFKRPDKT